MRKQQIEISLESKEEEAVVLINEDGEFVEANEQATVILGREMEEILSTGVAGVLVNPSLQDGKHLERKLNGKIREDKSKIIRGDGAIIQLELEYKPVDIGGERHALCTIVDSRELEPPSPDTEPGETPDGSMFDDISDEELKEIVQNIRVDAPDGEMPLNAIMLDLAAGHNELEQYKKGALSMHSAVDERLKEEERRDPESHKCEVLREVKKTAFGLYLRIQRGDKELHGHRDGEYSGYFN